MKPEHGYGVGLCDLVDADAAQPLVSELERAGATVRYRRVDVTDQPAMQDFIAETSREFGGLDVCIAAARRHGLGIDVRNGILVGGLRRCLRRMVIPNLGVQ